MGIATLSLLGLFGAYLMGRAFGGRGIGIATVLLLMVTPIYLEQAHVLRAEGPSTGLMVLAVGAAFMWWEHPIGRSGTAYCALSATALAMAVLIKLLAVTAIVPIVLLALARMWQIRNETTANIWGDLCPLGVATIRIIRNVRYFGSIFAFLEFAHGPGREISFGCKENDGLLGKRQCSNLKSVLCNPHCSEWSGHCQCYCCNCSSRLAHCSSVGLVSDDFNTFNNTSSALVASCHRARSADDCRCCVGPKRILHGADASMAHLGTSSNLPDGHPHVRSGPHRAAVRLSSLPRSLGRQKADPVEHSMVELAGDLQKTTTRDQWIVTDAQYVAAMANRDVPPWLVDTSITRVMSKYLTTQDLKNAASDPRVHTIVFATDHFTLPQVADFHPWVKEHFNLVRSYGNGIEVWDR